MSALPRGGKKARWTLPKRWAVPPRRVVLWSVASALPLTVVILLGAYLSHHAHTLLVESRARVDRTQQVLASLNRLFISLEDAETGQRGFVITGQEKYLAPYVSAGAALPQTYLGLRALLADTPAQALRLQRLQTLIDSKLQELNEVVAVRRASGFEAAASAISNDEGKRLMDRVRDEIDAIAGAEQQRLAQQQREAQGREQDLLRIGMVVAALSVVTRIVLAFLLARWRRRGLARPAS